MPEGQAAGTYVWTDLARLVRYSWIVAAVAGAAAAILLTSVSKPSEEVRLRQAMTVEGADWTELPTAHERNQAWIEQSLPSELVDVGLSPLPSVEVERTRDDATSFFIIVRANDDASAEAALDMAIDGVGTVLPGWTVASDNQLAVLGEQLEAAQAELVKVTALADELRRERETAWAEGEQARGDELNSDLSLADDDRRRLNGTIGDLERDLDRLAFETSSRPKAVVVGEPYVETSTPAVSLQAMAAAFGFAAAVAAAMAAMVYDRRRGRLRNLAGLRRSLPGHRVAFVGPEALADGGSADLAAVAHQVANDLLRTLTIIDASGNGGAQVLGPLQSELLLESRPSRALPAELLSGESTDLAGLEPDEVALIMTSTKQWRVAERVAAHSAHAVVMVDRRTRTNSVHSIVGRLETLGVEVLLVALVDSVPEQTEQMILTRQTVGQPV